MSHAFARLPLPQATAVALFTAWPVINLISRQSPPVVAGGMAVVLIWALLAEGRGAELKDAALGLLRAPEVWLLLIALVLIWVGTRLSPVPKRAVQAAGQMSLGLAIGLALAVSARALSAAAAAPASLLTALVGIPALLAMIRFWDPLHSLFGIRDLITHTNRTAVLLAMLLPVAAYWCHRRHGVAAMLALAAAMIGAVFFSLSESAKLAVAVGLAVAGLHRLLGRPLIWAVGVLSALIILFAPYLGLHIFDLIPGWVFRNTSELTFGVRGEIWREFSTLALLKPLIGWGIEASSSPLSGLDASTFSAAQRRALEIGHTHNAPLQIWYEMGLVGAAVAAALVLAVTARIARMAAGAEREVAFAVASAAFAISSVSHGVWQVWWYCLVALVAVLAPGLRRTA